MINNFKLPPYHPIYLLSVVLLLLSVSSNGNGQTSQQIETTKNAKSNSITTLINLPPISPELQNLWTPELETGFQQRAATVINYYQNQDYGTNQSEYEKTSYPKAMLDFLAGNRQRAIAFLQQEDSEALIHNHTAGIDYYYSFTLKAQIRKYFLFGQLLDPKYHQRMYQGAKKWTTEDPLQRPHPIYNQGDGTGRDWDISKRGYWVDGRNTDNLRAMRETSVYLMAEATGNEATRILYKQKIKRYVFALYHIGMGEWDSEVYHGHTFSSYLNLYDFAQDYEVKQLAKFALDWLATAAAVKYSHGGWGGSSKRDYGGGNVVYGSAAARTFWLYFGDNSLPNPEPELDSLYLITSSYRPPQAVVALARKQFKKPVELLATKPIYENWKPGQDQQPAYWETTFFGQTYQMGSVVSSFADGDVSPFKLMANNSQRGIDYVVINTGKDGLQQGKNAGDQIGQYRNLMIWLRPASDTNFFWQLPQTAKLEIKNKIWFVELEKTWLAIHPINLNQYQLVAITNPRHIQIYAQEKLLQATSNNQGYSGFVLEVGDQESYGNYQQFQQAIIDQSQLNLNQLATGIITYQSPQQQTLQLTYNQENLLPFLQRNSQPHYWLDNFDLYQSLDTETAPISLGWKQGKLQVNAGGLVFVSDIGSVLFSDE